MSSPKLPVYDVKIIGGKKIIIWNKQDEGRYESSVDESEHRTDDEDDDHLSEEGRNLVENDYEPEKESISLSTTSSSHIISQGKGVGSSSWGFKPVQKVEKQEKPKKNEKMLKDEENISIRRSKNIQIEENENTTTREETDEKDARHSYKRSDTYVNLPYIDSVGDFISESPSKERSKSPPSLSSSFKLLPPIRAIQQEDKQEDEFDYNNDDDLSDFCMMRMRKISERTLNVMLMEMRKLDRDRERIVHPSTLDNMVHKYKLPISPCLPRLKDKFEDKNYPGFTNYEHVVRFLEERRLDGQQNNEDKMPEVAQHDDTTKKSDSNRGRKSKPTQRVSTYSPPKRTLQRSRSWSDEKESNLIKELVNCLVKQRVDMDKLESIMRSKDHYGNDQLSGQQIGVSLRVAGITLDKGVIARWMKAADIIGKGIYSIPVLIDTLGKAAMEARGERAGQTGGKTQSSSIHNLHTAENENEQDTSWKNILDLNTSLPKQKTKITLVDSNMKHKNVGRLKASMYSSYHQYQGFLPPKDVVQLSLAYSTVYYLGVDQEGIRGAIDCAREQGVKMGMINIEKYIEAILDYIM